MKRWSLAVVTLFLAAPAARAHFIWIVPDADQPTKVRVVFSDTLADAEVAILAPGAAKAEDVKTDTQGEFAVRVGRPGLYGLRARYTEARAGEQDGKKYDEARSYATLVVQLGERNPGTRGAAHP